MGVPVVVWLYGRPAANAQLELLASVGASLEAYLEREPGLVAPELVAALEVDGVEWPATRPLDPAAQRELSSARSLAVMVWPREGPRRHEPAPQTQRMGPLRN